MRHLMLAHDRVDLHVRLSISNTLCPILHQLPDLQTITLNAINGAKIGNDYFLLNLPEKITSINVAEVVDFRAVEKQFPHLVHCNAPWEPGMAVHCQKMPNLRRLLFHGVPESFHFFTIMKQLESFTWNLECFEVQDWNQFTRSVHPTLHTLHIQCSHFEQILDMEDALQLPFLKVFYLDFLGGAKDLPRRIKRVLPQVKHFHAYLHGVKEPHHIEWLRNYVPLYAHHSGLETFSVYFLYGDAMSMRLTYYRGDKSAFLSRQVAHSFGTD